MTFNVKALARKEIIALQPYQPNREDTAEQLRLHTNENRFRAQSYSRYPEAQVNLLTRRLAELYAVGDENILLTRGSDDAIDALSRVFLNPGKDKILTFPPTFGMYALSAQIQGCDAIELPLIKDAVDFTAAQMKCDQEKNIKLVYLCTPQNPLGGLIGPEKIIAFAKQNPQKIVVVDEAYIEFSNTPSLATHINKTPNIVVLRTLSKAWGLAGCRLGAVIADKEILSLLNKVLPPYALPVPSIEIALKTLNPSGIARQRSEVQSIIKERGRLQDKLKSSSLVEYIYPSEANFLLVRFKDADAILKTFSGAGIIVRDMRKAQPNCLRITIATPDENNMLLMALGIDEPLRTLRQAAIERTSLETSIFVSVNLDKTEPISINTGIGFFDHMLEQLSKHSGIAMNIQAKGDLEIDAHHTVEDVMLTLGEALRVALGDKHGIGRYGFALPMDETRAEVLIDLSGRALCRIEGQFETPMLGDLPTQMIPHAFQSLAIAMQAAIHVKFDGENDHHKAEGAFKALAKCLKAACKREGNALPSTKGML